MSKEQEHRRYLDENHLCWTDDAGALHIDAVKACVHFGYPPTNENQDTMIRSLLKVSKEMMPKAKQQIVDDSTGCMHEFYGTRHCVKCGWEPDFQGGPMGGA